MLNSSPKHPKSLMQWLVLDCSFNFLLCMYVYMYAYVYTYCIGAFIIAIIGSIRIIIAFISSFTFSVLHLTCILSMHTVLNPIFSFSQAKFRSE